MKNLMVRTQTFRGLFARLGAIALLAAFLTAAPFHASLAQVAPSLGTAQPFAVLGGSTVTNTGSTIITGDLGVSPGTAVTGFPPGIVTGGTIDETDAASAQSATTTAYNNLVSQACGTTISADLGGMTLTPGVYCSASSMGLTGTLTLDAGGNPNAVWVFQMGSTLTTASNSSVLVINGGQPCNVFWQVGSSATLGADTTFIGNILALASITLTTGANMSGRALAQNGAVTLDTNAVAISVCAVPPVAPTLGKAFSPATIDAGGVSTLTITLSNASGTAATLTAPLTDTLPTGVVIATTPTASTTCGGTLTATAGTSTVTLNGGSIPPNSSCTVAVNVTAPLGGSYFNSLAAGTLQTSNGNNAAPAVATLTVPQPPTAPTLGKAFSPATINAGGVSTLTITLSNASGTAAGLTAPLIDTLPSGVVIASPTGASNGCAGTLTANAGDSTVTLTGGSILANGSCTVTVNVTAPLGGSYFNSLAAGALQTTNGSNAAPAVATLTVNTPAVAPTLGKAFSPATINAGGVSTLTITLSNASGTAATLTSPLIDTLPSGVVIAATPTASTTCGGTLTANAGDSTVTLTGGSILNNSSCTVTVNVTAPLGGSYFNSLAAGALVTSNGSNAAPAIATLTVSPPSAVTLSKAFSPATINAGGVSTITITLSNASSSIAYCTAPLTDILPSGLVVAGDSQVAGTSHVEVKPLWNVGTTCGLGLFGSAGDSTVTLTECSIPANGSCWVTVNVTAPVAGSYFNSLAAGDLETSNGNNAAPAVATLTVLPTIVPPKLSKVFSPATITAGGVSTLTITLSNPDLNNVATLTAPLTDYLPSGVVIAPTPSASTTCGGTLTANAGGSTVTLASGSSIPANSSCTVTVNVTAKNKGCYRNTLPAKALQTSNGSNAAPAVATLTVTPPVAPTLSKAFSPATINAGAVSALTITLNNPNSTVANLTAPLTDYLPSGVVIAPTPSASTICGGTLTANAGGSTVTLASGSSIPANSSCTVTVNVTAKNKGCYYNTLPAKALQTSNGSNATPAVATLTVKTK
jgi:uncharacterized repeat protein (TIGR01451 family)